MANRLPIVVAILALVTGASASAAERVNVYSARHDSLIEPLLKRFTERTGIETGLVTGNADAMLKRLQVEGAATPADVLITVDAARLHRAKADGLFQATDSAALREAVPAHLRDPDAQWFGLSRRARVIAYSPERVDTAALSTYEALADERWQGRLCVRSSDNVYNQSLLASLIAAHDQAFAREWAGAIIDNMARPPQGGDTAQLRAISAGICDVAIVNTYYYARMADAGADSEARAVAEQVELFFPNQSGRGAHVNVTGGAIGPYPFNADTVSLGRIGELNPTAVRLFDRVGWR